MLQDRDERHNRFSADGPSLGLFGVADSFVLLLEVMMRFLLCDTLPHKVFIVGLVVVPAPILDIGLICGRM